MKRVALFCGILSVLWPALSFASDKATFGYLENILILPQRFPMAAKLDTGADHSSMHARVLKRERRNGQDWIIFEAANKSGATVTFDKPVRRVAKVRRHFGKIQKRPVVMMEICVGKVRKNVEVNLVDRKQLSFKLLIGRSFLKGTGLVDSGLKYTVEPTCS